MISRQQNQEDGSARVLQTFQIMAIEIQHKFLTRLKRGCKTLFEHNQLFGSIKPDWSIQSLTEQQLDLQDDMLTIRETANQPKQSILKNILNFSEFCILGFYAFLFQFPIFRPNKFRHSRPEAFCKNTYSENTETATGGVL